MEKARARRLELDLHLELPVATFKTSVNQRLLMLTFEEQLHKDFDLSLLQRQSQDWASKCCGLNLFQLAKSVKRAVRREETRKIRQQVARELAQVVEAAGKK